MAVVNRLASILGKNKAINLRPFPKGQWPNMNDFFLIAHNLSEKKADNKFIVEPSEKDMLWRLGPCPPRYILRLGRLSVAGLQLRVSSSMFLSKKGKILISGDIRDKSRQPSIISVLVPDPSFMAEAVNNRKNRLFVGSEDGGKASVTILSLVQTCRNLGINPQEYLEDVLRRILRHSVKQIHKFLPDNWLAARAEYRIANTHSRCGRFDGYNFNVGRSAKSLLTAPTAKVRSTHPQGDD